MSGSSDYTRTANLQLYKPTPMADLNAWGTHLNSNADTLDALLGSGGAPGAWLPLTGGTVSPGPLNLTGHSRQGYATNPPTWASSNPNGNGWFEMIAEAQFYSKSGGIAVAAVGRASDYTTGTPHQIYAFAGMGMADVAGAVAEGMYLEAIATVGGANANCIEIDAINAGAVVPTINPYQTLNTGAVAGIVIASGGGSGERPGPIYPASAAIVIDRNANHFMRGIVFGAGGIDGTDGTTGTGIAIQMGKGHEIQWTYDNTGTRASFIRCDATAPSLGIAIENSNLYVVDAATEATHFGVTSSGATAYNALTANGAALFNSGLSFASAVAPGGVTDLSKHIMLGYSCGLNITSGSLNYVATTGNVHSFVVNGMVVGTIGANGIMTGSAGSPTWTSGSAAPVATAPPGSIYSRTGGAVGATLYVSRGGGTWNPVAGV